MDLPGERGGERELSRPRDSRLLCSSSRSACNPGYPPDTGQVSIWYFDKSITDQY